jgi:hypothetical protein
MKFIELNKNKQVGYVREFCNDQALDYLYPEESLGDLIDAWGLSSEDAFVIGMLNADRVNERDKYFIGDVESEEVSSFVSWREYMEAAFIPEVWEEFEEWMKENHPELEVMF